MTDIQAALGLSQLDRLGDFVKRRTQLADRYDRLLALRGMALPARDPSSASAWHLYTVGWNERASGMARAEAFARLRARGINANVHYIPVHLQPYYRRLGFRTGQFPNAEAYYASALTLPLYPRLAEAEQDIVVDCLLSMAVPDV
jgi:dTDP-4-amino-4,6-dideoxygalactose transaminase